MFNIPLLQAQLSCTDSCEKKFYEKYTLARDTIPLDQTEPHTENVDAICTVLAQLAGNQKKMNIYVRV